jgi:CMP-N,N'-diacetyllegionaminic acid synthase
MNILGIIPARGGSKGVPRKNLTPLLGKPLIAYTIESALNSQYLTDVVVSTEDEEIARVSSSLGALVPFIRPAELATDSATSLPVIQHAITEMEKNKGFKYDIIVYLQPTTPLRTTQNIDEGIQLLLDTDADSVVSVVDVGGNHPLRMKRLIHENILINYIDQGHEDMRPRQQLPPVYIRSGELYISKRSVIMEQGLMVGNDCRGYKISPEWSANIDTQFDLLLAEYLLKKRSGQIGL